MIFIFFQLFKERCFMNFLVIGVGVLFAILSTIVLSYISIATMVGPWIAPTLVLLGHMIFKLKNSHTTADEKTESVAWVQAIGAGGGIIATGIGFALPMLFFLDPSIFDQWLKSPLYFCSIITTLCLLGGGLGLWLARWWKDRYMIEQALPFPVSKLTYQVITSQSHPKQAQQLLQGILGSTILCALRDGIWRFNGILAKTYYAFPSIFAKEIGFSVWPSLWAIGFSVGLSITIPLFVGLISKYIILFPLANHANYLPFSLFAPMSTDTFTIAFCSGLVLCEVVFSFPTYIKKWIGWIKHPSSRSKANNNFVDTIKQQLQKNNGHFIELAFLTIGIISMLTYFSFSIPAQILLITFAVIATYSINQIGGKIGMIPFGRYSTFIVVPLLLLFKLSAIQATITCVFFNICAAAASDLLFDYKTGELGGLDQKKMYRYQWIGLIATALSIGVILWLLFSHLQLGSEALFAQRGKAKALLLQSLYFDKYIVLMGILFGWVLKKFKLSPTMVFGGLIMPNSVSIGLMIGSLGTLLTKHTEKYQPLCAGILAAESLWILISIVAGML
jgi:hypothetical protein